MSLMKTYIIETSTSKHLVPATIQRIENTFDGNPQYLIQVWTKAENGHVWYPKIDGYRDRKDQHYRVISHTSLQSTLNEFMEAFENHLYEATK